MAERQRTNGRRARARVDPYVRPEAPNGSWKHDRDQDDREVRPAARNSSISSTSDTVVVSNLHYEVMPADLMTIFEAMGTLAREPTIKYDRSGRSLGVGFVQFAKPQDAQMALRLDGSMAKGKSMHVSIDHSRKGNPLGRSAPTGPKNSLLSRVGSAPLVDRVAKSGPQTAGDKPARNRPAKAGSNNAGSGKRATDTTAAKSSKPAARVPKTPKTAEDLDRELEAYLDVEPSAAAASSGASASVPAATATATAATAAKEDVDMA